MAYTAINAPWSVLKNYDLTYEPPKVVKNVVSFTTTEHDRVYEGLNILANGTGIVLNHRTIFRDCRIRFVRCTAITGGADASGSEFVNCLFDYTPPPTIANSLPSAWVTFALTNADHIRLHNVTMKGSAGGLILSNCLDFKANQLRMTALKNVSGGTAGYFVKATNCLDLELLNFATINPLASSYTNHLIHLDTSHGAHLANGTLDGNNMPTGAGIYIEDSSACKIENIDAIRMSDAAVNVVSGHSNHLKRVRVRQNNGVGTGGRAAPTDGGYAFKNNALHTVYERCQVDALAVPANILLEGTDSQVLTADIRTEAFVMGE